MTSQGVTRVSPGRDAPERYWLPVLVRAAIAIVVAVIITFVPDHSPALGLAVFGGFAIATGVTVGIGGIRSLAGASRSFSLALAAVSAVLGIVALLLNGGGLPFLIFIVSTWAAITGFIELLLGLRNRGRSPLARDWLFAGGLTMLFAAAVLLVPPGLVEEFTGPDGVQRALTASVIVVGALGAYSAIVGVYLAIAGLSLKWTKPDAAEDAHRSNDTSVTTGSED